MPSAFASVQDVSGTCWPDDAYLIRSCKVVEFQALPEAAATYSSIPVAESKHSKSAQADTSARSVTAKDVAPSRSRTLQTTAVLIKALVDLTSSLTHPVPAKTWHLLADQNCGLV